MAPKPKEVNDAETIERVLYVPGWGYNLIIRDAERRKRTVKHELSDLLEWALREKAKAGDNLPAPTQ